MEGLREISLLIARTVSLRHQWITFLICILVWYPESSFTQNSIPTSIPYSPLSNYSLPMEDFITEVVTDFVNISVTTMVAETELLTEPTDNPATELITEKARKMCCLEGCTEVDNNCFLYQNMPTNFLGALELCSFYNEGSLAKIEPLTAVANYLLEILKFFDDTDFVWIGLARGENGTFEWSYDEEPLNVSNWHTGQPSSFASQRCVAANRNGTWEVRSCNETELPYLCQSRHVFCGELTTALEVTFDVTTEEFTEEVTNATTTKLSTTTPTPTATNTSPQTTNFSSPTPATTTKRARPQTTVDSEEATTEMITFDETTRTKPTTTIKSTTTLMSTTLKMASTSSSTASATNASATPSMSSSEIMTSGMATTKRPSAQSTQTVLNRVRSTSAISDQTVSGAVSTTTQLPIPVPPRPGLGPINKLLISIIVIFSVLAIIIGCIVIYLLYKRKQSKQSAYNVEEAELDGINSVEDLAGPSTSASETSGGIASTSFINDELPGFSGSHFSGLRGKRYSYDIT